MSYLNDYSFCYSSGEDSFSYISDSSFYCPVHYPPPSNVCPIHQPYPFYFQVATPPSQPQYQVSNFIQSSPSIQVHPIQQKSNRRFTEDQIRILEEHFTKVNKYLSKETIDELSTRTQLKPSQIRVWFNNKRTREQRH
jgi:hypothetical protein